MSIRGRGRTTRQQGSDCSGELVCRHVAGETMKTMTRFDAIFARALGLRNRTEESPRPKVNTSETAKNRQRTAFDGGLE